MRIFLTAEWKNLLNLTWKVDPELLRPHLPEGLELDIQEGKAFVSLVAFDFENTRVKGIKIPFHIDFPEINLRFYVKKGKQRGVVFIREYVPKHCIAFIAQKLYNEPYVSYPMESELVDDKESEKQNLVHKIWREDKEHRIEVNVSGAFSMPAENSLAHYFKEHDAGFGVDHSGKTLFYMVDHEPWETKEIVDYKLDYDFAELYGEQWKVLNETKPFLTLYAKGSAVKVFHPYELAEWDKVMAEFKMMKENEGDTGNKKKVEPATS